MNLTKQIKFGFSAVAAMAFLVVSAHAQSDREFDARYDSAIESAEQRESKAFLGCGDKRLTLILEQFSEKDPVGESINSRTFQINKQNHFGYFKTLEGSACEAKRPEWWTRGKGYMSWNGWTWNYIGTYSVITCVNKQNESRKFWAGIDPHESNSFTECKALLN